MSEDVPPIKAAGDVGPLSNPPTAIIEHPQPPATPPLEFAFSPVHEEAEASPVARFNAAGHGFGIQDLTPPMQGRSVNGQNPDTMVPIDATAMIDRAAERAVARVRTDIEDVTRKLEEPGGGGVPEVIPKIIKALAAIAGELGVDIDLPDEPPKPVSDTHRAMGESRLDDGHYRAMGESRAENESQNKGKDYDKPADTHRAMGEDYDKPADTHRAMGESRRGSGRYRAMGEDYDKPADTHRAMGESRAENDAQRKREDQPRKPDETVWSTDGTVREIEWRRGDDGGGGGAWSGRVWVSGKLFSFAGREKNNAKWVRVKITPTDVDVSLESSDFDTQSFPGDEEWYDLDHVYGDIHCDRF